MYATDYQRQPRWEAAASAAVHVGRTVIDGPASSLCPEEPHPHTGCGG